MKTGKARSMTIYGMRPAMADGIDFNIVGLEALRDKLKLLSEETQGRGGAAALRKASLVVVDAAKRNAERVDDPGTKEKISENIVTRKASKRRVAPGDIKYRVGVLGGARDYSAYGELSTGKSASENPGGDTFYWRFLEFGTEKMSAKPFMRGALAQNVSKATETFVREYIAYAERALKRAKKS